MGSPIGLLFTIDADPSRAGAALESFQSQVSSAASTVNTSFATSAAGPKELEDNILSARESTRLLSEEFGMHLPRAVSSAMAEMMPAVEALGPALLGAFAAVEGAKVIDSLRGITAEFQKEYDLTVKINDILVGKQSYAQLAREVADNRAELTKLNAEQEKYITGAGKSTEEQGALRHAAIAVTEALTPMPQKFYDNRAEIERINALLPKLTEEMTRAGVAEGKLGIVHEHTTGSLKAHTQSMDAYNESLLRARNSEIEEISRLEKENALMAERQGKENEALQWKGKMDWEMAEHKAAVQIAAENDAIAARNLANWKANIQALADARQALADTKQAELELATATMASTAASVLQGVAAGESFTQAAHDALKGLAIQSATKAIYEFAEGMAMVALNFFIPNPAYIASADAHFTASGMYAAIGGMAGASAAATGGGGGSRASAGGGTGGGARAGSRGSGAGSQSGGFQPPGLGGPASERAGWTGNLIVQGTLIHQNDLLSAISEAIGTGTQRGNIVVTPVSDPVPRH